MLQSIIDQSLVFLYFQGPAEILSLKLEYNIKMLHIMK